MREGRAAEPSATPASCRSLAEAVAGAVDRLDAVEGGIGGLRTCAESV